MQPASIDVHLADDVRIPRLATLGVTVDLRFDDPNELCDRAKLGNYFRLKHGRKLLAHTAEVITVPDQCIARIEGKSSLARLFLVVHHTAGFLDPGFSGQVVLEVNNLGDWDVILYAGMPIAQVTVALLRDPPLRLYGAPGLGSHYQHQRGPQGAIGKRGPGGVT